jgi:hypothetical protein
MVLADSQLSRREGSIMVSQYLVSWIQVAGLIVGLLGLFYLSLGVFGKTGTSFLRPLLPATANGLSFGLLEWVAAQITPKIFSGFEALLIGIGFAGVGYYLALLIQTPSDWFRKQARIVAFGMGGVALLIGLANLAVAVSGYLGVGIPVRDAPMILVLAVLTLTNAASYAFVLIVPRLSERRLQTVGFGASVLAILTQFIPPVLDILNIHVVR